MFTGIRPDTIIGESRESIGENVRLVNAAGSSPVGRASLFGADPLA